MTALIRFRLFSPWMFLTMAMICSCTNYQQKNTIPPSPPYQAQERTLSAVVVSTQSVHNETEHQLINELFGPNSPAQQNINPYSTMPVIPHTVKEMRFASGMKEKK